VGATNSFNNALKYYSFTEGDCDLTVSLSGVNNGETISAAYSAPYTQIDISATAPVALLSTT
jgi:hypothetical protein